MNRRTFLNTTFLSLLPLANPSNAQASTQTSHAEATYKGATRLLKDGRRYEVAANLFRHCMATEPKSSRYHSGLACALTARAVSFAQANLSREMYAEDQGKYQWLLAQWKQAQSDNPEVEKPVTLEEVRQEFDKKWAAENKGQPLDPQLAPGIDRLLTDWVKQLNEKRFKRGDPAPAPPVLRTRDDNKPFVLTEEETNTKFKRLAEEAIAHFQTAVDHAATEKEKAERQWERSCGLRLLLHYAALKPIPLSVTTKEALEANQQATQLAPTTSVYFQALADTYRDILPPSRAEQEALRAKPVPLESRINVTETTTNALTIAAYRKAIELSPKDHNLTYGLFDAIMQNKENANSEEITALIDRLAGNDAQNAHLFYTAAAFHFLAPDAKRLQAKSVQTSLAFLEKGNAAPICQIVYYQEAVPSTLTVVWNRMRYDSSGRVRDLFNWQAMTRQLITLPFQEPELSRERTECILRLPLDMTNRMAASLPPDSSTWTGDQMLVDILTHYMAQNSYTNAIKLYQKLSDNTAEQRTRTQLNFLNTAYKQRSEQRMRLSAWRYGNY